MRKSNNRKRLKNDSGDYKSDQRSRLFLDDNRFQLQPLSQSQLSSMIRSRNDKFAQLLERFVGRYENQELAKRIS